MTFSIVARSADGHSHGVAVASKFLAVGSAVPAAQAQIGALATQSYANLGYRPQGLTLLRTGVAAADVVAGLTAADPSRDQRQLGVVGPTGDGATYTGTACHEWAGGFAGADFTFLRRAAYRGAGGGRYFRYSRKKSPKSTGGSADNTPVTSRIALAATDFA